jgi:hypothetical protein
MVNAPTKAIAINLVAKNKEEVYEKVYIFWHFFFTA